MKIIIPHSLTVGTLTVGADVGQQAKKVVVNVKDKPRDMEMKKLRKSPSGNKSDSTSDNLETKRAVFFAWELIASHRRSCIIFSIVSLPASPRILFLMMPFLSMINVKGTAFTPYCLVTAELVSRRTG